MTGSDEPWWRADRAAQFRAFADSDGRTAPLYRRLAEAAADDPEVLALLDAAPGSQQRTVLLFAAVHFLVLGDPGCELAGFYPSVAGQRADGDPWPAFRAFCLDRRAEVQALVATRHTQTNEVGRCAALLPALELVHRAVGQPLTLVEVGASAGLNLCLDRYRVDYGTPTWQVDPWPAFEPAAGAGPGSSPVAIRTRVAGERLPPVPAPGTVPPIAERAGLDLHPVDVTDDEAVRWLEACVFPDRVDRAARLRAAVAVAREEPPRVVAGDMGTDLVALASGLGGDGPLVVAHSWALTYLDDPGPFVAQLEALARQRDLWWVSIEPSRAVHRLTVPPRDLRYTAEMAANTVTSLMHVHPDGTCDDLVLARSHPHLDWLHWLAPG